MGFSIGRQKAEFNFQPLKLTGISLIWMPAGMFLMPLHCFYQYTAECFDLLQDFSNQQGF